MKKLFGYIGVIAIGMSLMGYGAYTLGIKVIHTNCPPLVMDCSDALYYQPFFWLPLPLVVDGYTETGELGFYYQNYYQILAVTLLYWFGLANVAFGLGLILKKTVLPKK